MGRRCVSLFGRPRSKSRMERVLSHVRTERESEREREKRRWLPWVVEREKRRWLPWVV